MDINRRPTKNHSMFESFDPYDKESQHNKIVEAAKKKGRGGNTKSLDDSQRSFSPESMKHMEYKEYFDKLKQDEADYLQSQSENLKKELDVRKRRNIIEELYKKRLSVSEISRELDVPSEDVMADVKFLRDMWVREGLNDIEVIKIRELLDLEEMEKECVRRLDACSIPTAGTRWMEERRKIKERRAKMLGIDAAERHFVASITAHIDKNTKDSVIRAALATNGFDVDKMLGLDKKEQLPMLPIEGAIECECVEVKREEVDDGQEQLMMFSE